MENLELVLFLDFHDTGSFWNNLEPSLQLCWPEARVLTVLRDTPEGRIIAEGLPSNYRKHFVRMHADATSSQHRWHQNRQQWQQNRQEWFSMRFFADTLTEARHIALIRPDTLFVSRVTNSVLFASGWRPQWAIDVMPKIAEMPPSKQTPAMISNGTIACMSTSPLLLWREHLSAFRKHLEHTHGMPFDNLLEEFVRSAMHRPRIFEELFCNYVFQHQQHQYLFHTPAFPFLGSTHDLPGVVYQPLPRLALQGSNLDLKGRQHGLTSCLLDPPWQCKWYPLALSVMLEGYCRSRNWRSRWCSLSRLPNRSHLNPYWFSYKEPVPLDWASLDFEGCIAAEREHQAAVREAPVAQEVTMLYLFWLLGGNSSSLELALGGAASKLDFGTEHWWEGLHQDPEGIYSQDIEDRILHFLFEHVGTHSRFYVEIGAQDGQECNTRLLREKLGFQGVTFDVGFEDVKIGLYKEHVLPHNVGALLSRYSVPHDPDVLSIDVDSFDAFLLQAALASTIRGQLFRPRVIVVEANDNFGDDSFLSFPGDVEVKGFQPPYQELCGWTCIFFDPRDQLRVKRAMCGAGPRALAHIAAQADYFPVYLNGINMFFLRADLVPEPMRQEWAFEDVMRHSITLGREKFAFPRPECDDFVDGLVDVRMARGG